MMRVGLNCSSSLRLKSVANRKMLIIQMFTLEQSFYRWENKSVMCSFVASFYIVLVSGGECGMISDKKEHAMVLCFHPGRLATWFQTVAVSQFLALRNEHTPCHNRQRQWTSVLRLFKLGRIPANKSLEGNTVFFSYFCKLLCTKTYPWEEKWHCFLYPKLFKKWVETPINLGCVVTWAYFLLWGRVDSS